jgi:hypothetical protein
MKFRRRLRWTLVVCSGVLAVVLIAVAAGRWYLRREILSQLTAFNGAPVVVDRVELGFRRQAARGIQLFEGEPEGVGEGKGEGKQPPWLTASRAELELSVWEALRGQKVPRRITVEDVNVVLQFDDRGDLLTRLPMASDGRDWKLPAGVVDAVNASVEIRQRGRRALAVRSIGLQLKQQDATLQATGRVGDLLGAEWTFGGRIDVATQRATWESATKRLRIQSNDLAQLPFVPVESLPGVSFAAVTPVAISGRFAPGDDLHYQMELAPESFSVDVARADLRLTNGRGKIVAEDGVLSLTELQGDVFGGRVAIDGNFDFREMPGHGGARIGVENLGLERLPESWKFPTQAGGTFSGQGDFTLHITESGPRLEGTGDGSIVDATIFGLAAEPMGIHVTIDRASGGGEKSADAIDVAGQLRVDVAMEDVDVAEAARRADVDAVASLRGSPGRVSLSGSIVAPLESLSDPATYDAEGRFELAEAELSGVEVRTFRSPFDYSKGTLTVGPYAAEIAHGGRIGGRVEAGLDLAVPKVVATAQFERLSSQVVSEFISAAKENCSGAFSGRVEAAVDLDRWDDPRAWQASGQAETPRLEIGGITLSEVSTQLRLDGGKLNLSEFTARGADTRLEGRAVMEISEPFGFDGRLLVKGLDLAAAGQRARVELPVPVAGTADVLVAGRGTLAPLRWSAEGTAQSPELTVADVSARDVRGEWTLDADAFELKRVRARLLGGRAEVNATFPFAGDDGVQLLGSFQQFDPSLVLRKVVPGSEIAIAGSLSGTITAVHLEDPGKATGRIGIEGRLVDARGVAVEQISGELPFAGGAIGIDVAGRVFDGQVGFHGEARPDDTRPEKPLRIAGRLTVDNADLGQLAAIGGPRLRNLGGRARGEFDLQLTGPEFPLAGQGLLVLQDVDWDRNRVSDLAQCSIVVADNSLRLTRVFARVAGGTLTGDATLHLDRPGEGTFFVAANQVSLSKLPGAWRRSLGGTRGNVSGSFRGRTGQVWQGTGQVRMVNGNVAGVPIQSLRAPVDWTFLPRTRHVQARARVTSARVARGRVSGELRVRWSGRLDLSGNLKVVRADMRTLARAAPRLDDSLDGMVSCDVSFQGSSVRSVRNLSGAFSAELLQSRTMMLPVLQALTASLGFSSPSSETFSKTEARGRFSRGTLQIDRMTLESPDTHVYITGKMNHHGTLDFDVTADAKSLVTAGVVVGVFRPTDLLFRRLVFLHVGGSLRSPIVQPRVAEFVEQEIVRFFLPFVVP